MTENGLALPGKVLAHGSSNDVSNLEIDSDSKTCDHQHIEEHDLLPELFRQHSVDIKEPTVFHSIAHSVI